MSDDHPEGEGPPGCVIYVFVVIALLLAPFYYAYLALRAIFHRLQGPVGFFALCADHHRLCCRHGPPSAQALARAVTIARRPRAAMMRRIATWRGSTGSRERKWVLRNRTSMPRCGSIHVLLLIPGFWRTA